MQVLSPEPLFSRPDQSRRSKRGSSDLELKVKSIVRGLVDDVIHKRSEVNHRVKSLHIDHVPEDNLYTDKSVLGGALVLPLNHHDPVEPAKYNHPHRRPPQHHVSIQELSSDQPGCRSFATKNCQKIPEVVSKKVPSEVCREVPDVECFKVLREVPQLNCIPELIEVFKQ